LFQRVFLTVGDAGTVTPAKPSGKTRVSSRGGAKSGALDANLAEVIEAWERLPIQVRKAILSLARTASAHSGK
jgi:hypothetical protein